MDSNMTTNQLFASLYPTAPQLPIPATRPPPVTRQREPQQQNQAPNQRSLSISSVAESVRSSQSIPANLPGGIRRGNVLSGQDPLKPVEQQGASPTSAPRNQRHEHGSGQRQSFQQESPNHVKAKPVTSSGQELSSLSPRVLVRDAASVIGPRVNFHDMGHYNHIFT
eukprot:PhF_6_TR38388/c0_g1_i1/m.57178